MVEPRTPKDLIPTEEIKERVIARLLTVAGLLSGMAHEVEKRPDKESVAALRLLREYVLDAVYLLGRLP